MNCTGKRTTVNIFTPEKSVLCFELSLITLVFISMTTTAALAYNDAILFYDDD